MSNDFGGNSSNAEKTEDVMHGALDHPIGADRTQKVPTRWPYRSSSKGFSYDIQHATRQA